MQKRISVDDLGHGMYVAALDRPWLETSFVFQGFPIRSDEEIAALRRQCTFVIIDIEQSSKDVHARLLALPSPAAAPRAIKPAPTANRTDEEEDPQAEAEGLTREVETGLVVYSDAKSYIDAVLEDIRLGHSLDTRRARKLVSNVVDSVVRNVNALLLLTNLRHKDEYTSQHCVNVCILAVAFGRYLGLEKHDLNDLGLGALLHDIGKMKVPLEILNKPGRLTAEEFAVIKGHPTHGRRILDRVDGVPERVLDVVLSHHERADGSGYPRGARHSDISRFAMIVAIVDVYDAVTSDRVYHAGTSPHDALTMMYDRAPQTFDTDLFESFIRCLGIYPVGSLVELSTGEVAVVVGGSRRRQLKPVIMLVLDKDKQRYPVRRLFSLNQPGHSVEIRRILESKAFGIDVREILLDEFAAAF